MNYFKLEEQLLTKQNEKVIASGDCNTDFCSFEFDDAWDGFTKTVVFYQQKDKVFYAVLASDNTCTIPAASMVDTGKLYIGVFGINGNKILTSTVESIVIKEGAISGIDIELEPSDDIFLAIIAEYQKISEQMELHNQSASELKSSFITLEKTVSDTMEAQDNTLLELGAFDVLEMKETVNQIQTATNETKDMMELLQKETFVLANNQITFTDRVCNIADERVSSSDLVDVYFDAATFDSAISSKVDVDSCNGYIKFTCVTAPTYPLCASIIVRKVV